MGVDQKYLSFLFPNKPKPVGVGESYADAMERNRRRIAGLPPLQGATGNPSTFDPTTESYADAMRRNRKRIEKTSGQIGPGTLLQRAMQAAQAERDGLRSPQLAKPKKRTLLTGFERGF